MLNIVRLWVTLIYQMMKLVYSWPWRMGEYVYTNSQIMAWMMDEYSNFVSTIRLDSLQRNHLYLAARMAVKRLPYKDCHMH